MTKNELKALVAAKIAGQGTAVDAGPVLPAIFNGIIDGDASIAELDDFEEFDEATAYSTGDIVRRDGKLYKFIANKSAGAWDATKVTQTTVFAILSGMIGLLSSLTTTAKNNLVAAINEVNDKAPSEFVPIVDWESETIEPDDAFEKYGLSLTVFQNMAAGKIQSVAMGPDDEDVKLLITYRRPDVIACESALYATSFTIALTLDGNFTIAYVSE